MQIPAKLLTGTKKIPKNSIGHIVFKRPYEYKDGYFYAFQYRNETIFIEEQDFEFIKFSLDDGFFALRY